MTWRRSLPHTRRSVLSEVALLEEDEVLRTTVAEVTGASPARRRLRSPGGPGPTRHRARWVLLCAAALLVAPPAVRLVTGSPPGAPAAASSGVVAALGGPVTERWSAQVSLWPGAVAVDGLLVGVRSTPGGGTDVVALDAGTGATVWRALPGGVHGGEGALRCAAGPPRSSGAGTDDPTVVCLVAERTAARVDQAARHQVVTLDPATGSVLLRRPVDAASAAGEHGVPPSPSSTRLTVGGRVLEAGGTSVTAVDARTGTHLWTAPVGRVTGSPLVTDGRLLLATTASGTGDVTVTALGVDDGRQRWSQDIDDDLRLVVVGDRLFGLGPHRLVSFT